MKKLLVIQEFSSQTKSGGKLFFDRNIDVLKRLFYVEICPVEVKNHNKVGKIFNLIFSKIPSIYSLAEINRIKNIIKTTDCEYIFLNNSNLGYFAKFAKKFNKKIITYFQNFEYQLTSKIRSFVWKYSAKKNESYAISFSDFCVFLNERDKSEIEKYYGCAKCSSIIPITMLDTYICSEVEHNETYGLFVGSYYKPNLEAIDFINKISDKLNCNIKVVGYKLENYIVENKSKNIEIVGTVDDLSPYYLNSAFVIMPIFSGSGMKVKTCEALMNGKIIFATREALEGYLKTSDIFECDNAESFIEKINDYLKHIVYFSDKNRKLFLDNYSNENAYNKYLDIANHLNESKV